MAWKHGAGPTILENPGFLKYPNYDCSRWGLLETQFMQRSSDLDLIHHLIAGNTFLCGTRFLGPPLFYLGSMKKDSWIYAHEEISWMLS
jgi:hypothetical protein